MELDELEDAIRKALPAWELPHTQPKCEIPNRSELPSTHVQEEVSTVARAMATIVSTRRDSEGSRNDAAGIRDAERDLMSVKVLTGDLE